MSGYYGYSMSNNAVQAYAEQIAAARRYEQEWLERNHTLVVDQVPEGYSKTYVPSAPSGYRAYCNNKVENGRPVKGYRQVYVKVSESCQKRFIKNI